MKNLYQFSTGGPILDVNRTPFFGRKVSENGYTLKHCPGCDRRRTMPRKSLLCGMCLDKKHGGGRSM